LTTAFLGWGVWSLVLGSLAHQFVRMPALLFLNRWFPRLRFSAERFQKLFSFGSNLLGFNFLNYIARNLDNVIIGRFLGAAQLGYYDLAYQLMLKVLSNVSHTLSGAVFPVLSSVQHDKERVAEIYRSVVSYISLITFPVMVGISLVAPEFVLGVLGEKWAPAIDVVRVLGLVGAIQSVSGLVSDVFLSQGRSDLMLKWALVATPGAALAFWLGVRWGIVGVALCYLLFTLLAWVGSHALGFRLVGLSARRYLSGLVPASKACLVMVVTVFAARLMLAPWGASEVTELVILVAVGATVYTTTMWFERVEEVAKVRDSILAFAQRRLPRFLQPDRKTEIL
jgi:PST family polysaccharide transporter